MTEDDRPRDNRHFARSNLMHTQHLTHGRPKQRMRRHCCTFGLAPSYAGDASQEGSEAGQVSSAAGSGTACGPGDVNDVAASPIESVL